MRRTTTNYHLGALWPRLAIAGVLACTCFEIQATNSVSVFNATPACSKIRWLHADGQTKAGMAVQVTLNGKVAYFQLDTGAAQSVLYANVAGTGAYGLDLKAEDVSAVLGIGRTDSRTLRLNVNHDTVDNGHADDTGDDAETPVVGTLGLDGLIGRVSRIDFQTSEFCSYEFANAPDFGKEVTWIDARLQFGRLFLSIHSAKSSYDGFFYDSGSSTFFAVTDKPTWERLTGLKPNQATAHRSVDSWGSKLSFFGAQTRDALSIGKLHVGRPQIFSADVPLLNSAQGEHGVLGNAPFIDGALIISLGPAPRLGYVPPR
jgi:hypothetical protein